MTRSGLGLAQRIARAATVALLAALPVTGLAATGAQASSGAPELSLRAPAHATPGQVVTLHVVVRGAPTLGALQANLRFDERALSVVSVTMTSPLAGTGKVTALSAVETPNRNVIAGFSCLAPACATAPGTVANGTTVASVEVQPSQAGHIEIRLDGGLLVDHSGAVIARTHTSSVTLDVAGSSRTWRAPRGPELTTGKRRTADSADLTRDGRVTALDAISMERSFVTGEQHDVACATPEPGTDVNGDGCITIADLQTASARAEAPLAAATRATPVATYVVNSTADGGDVKADGICQTSTAGQCTLRAALQEANRASGPALINFNIPGTGVHTIAPGTQLPQLANLNGITIDGFTQPGSAPNTDPLADNAVYGIELKGTGGTGIDGLFITGANNLVRGLDMHAFQIAVWIYGTAATNNTVEGNMIGLLPDGSYDPGQKLVNTSSCVVMQQGAASNHVGVPGDANRNVVSGCDHIGIATYNYPTANNVIQNNIVGLDPTGTMRRGTISHGIDINTGTQGTIIGGTGFEERNVSSGNFQEGVEISHNPRTQFNSVIGNFIGTDLTGNAAPAYAQNSYWNVRLEGNPNCGSSPCPLDEGNETVSNNVIVNGGRGGIYIDKGVHDSVVANNKIGVTANGTPAPNASFGVRIEAGSIRNTVGPGNEIAYNAAGVQIQSKGVTPASPSALTNRNRITQNSIHDNKGGPALGIDLAPFFAVNTAANADANTNDAMLAPTLSNPTKTTVTATTCAGCTVELFVADHAAGVTGSGTTYLTSAVADGTGHAQVPVPANALGHAVTATSTNAAGSTSEFSTNVNIPSANPNNVPPVARFTDSCNGTLCSFDGTTSSDSDGSVVLYSWDFGDGNTGTGATLNHAYAAPGTYSVTLTVTDNDGGTNSVSHPANPVNNGAVALDSFTRTVSGGWGTADVGGAYTLAGPATNLSVASGTGLITIHAAASGNSATLLGTSVLNTDVVADTSTSLAPAGGTWGQVSYLTARRTAANTEYRMRLRFQPGGPVKLSMVKVVGSTTEVQIGTEVPLALTYTPGASFTMRFDVTGTNPTTLQGKVWMTGTTEPSTWNLTTTDSQAQLQAAGAAGVRAFLGGGATNFPAFTFDNLAVTDLG